MFYEIKDVLETTRMITQNNLDVRTITMGISLRDWRGSGCEGLRPKDL